MSVTSFFRVDQDLLLAAASCISTYTRPGGFPLMQTVRVDLVV